MIAGEGFRCGDSHRDGRERTDADHSPKLAHRCSVCSILTQLPEMLKRPPACPTDPPTEFSLRRRREEARDQLRTHRRNLANGVLWPVWGALALLSVFVVLSPLIGFSWRPEFGHMALIGAAVVVFLARELWLTIGAAGRVTKLTAELALHERAEQRRVAGVSGSEAERSGKKLPIPSEAATADLPMPAAQAAPSHENLPRTASTPARPRGDD